MSFEQRHRLRVPLSHSLLFSLSLSRARSLSFTLLLSVSSRPSASICSGCVYLASSSQRRVSLACSAFNTLTDNPFQYFFFLLHPSSAIAFSFHLCFCLSSSISLSFSFLSSLPYPPTPPHPHHPFLPSCFCLEMKVTPRLHSLPANGPKLKGV